MVFWKFSMFLCVYSKLRSQSLKFSFTFQWNKAKNKEVSDLNALTVILKSAAHYMLLHPEYDSTLSWSEIRHVCFTVTCCWIKTFKIVGFLKKIKFGTCSAARSYFPHDDDEEASWVSDVTCCICWMDFAQHRSVAKHHSASVWSLQVMAAVTTRRPIMS